MKCMKNERKEIIPSEKWSTLAEIQVGWSLERVESVWEVKRYISVERDRRKWDLIRTEAI